MKTAIMNIEKVIITGTYVSISNEVVANVTIADEQIAGGKYENMVFENVVFKNCTIQACYNCSWYHMLAKLVK